MTHAGSARRARTLLKALLGRPLVPSESNRLERIAHGLGIADNDALWSIAVTLEVYQNHIDDANRRLRIAIAGSAIATIICAIAVAALALILRGVWRCA